MLRVYWSLAPWVTSTNYAPAMLHRRTDKGIHSSNPGSMRQLPTIPPPLPASCRLLLVQQ